MTCTLSVSASFTRFHHRTILKPRTTHKTPAHTNAAFLSGAPLCQHVTGLFGVFPWKTLLFLQCNISLMSFCANSDSCDTLPCLLCKIARIFNIFQCSQSRLNLSETPVSLSWFLCCTQFLLCLSFSRQVMGADFRNAAQNHLKKFQSVPK